jgi:hypothetical protein
MMRVDSTVEGAAAAPPRKRGAPKGNRNAWKHGGRSAAAKRTREAARAKVVARLPDARVLLPSVKFANAAHALLDGGSSRARRGVAPEGEGGGDFTPNKTNNSLSRAEAGEGDPPSPFSPNKTNNSVAQLSGPRRGAPKGNKNALKHGMKSAERRAFGADLRLFLYRLDAMCALAHAQASTGARSKR